MQGTILVATAGQGVLRSNDDGATWARIPLEQEVEFDAVVRCLAVHPTEPHVVLAGADVGLARSEDAGVTWKRVGSPFDGQQVWAIAIDPHRPESILVGTGAPARAVMYRTDDGGGSWTRLAPEIPEHCAGVSKPRILTIAWDQVDQRSAWFGIEEGGLWLTRDRGDTWTRTDGTPKSLPKGVTGSDVHCVVVLDGPPKTLVCLVVNAIFVSTDDGETWTRTDTRATWGIYYTRLVTKLPGGSSLLLGIGDGTPGTETRIFRSDDLAQTWQQSTLDVPAGSTVWAFGVHDADPDLVFAGTKYGDLYRSTDGGRSFSKEWRTFPEVTDVAWTPHVAPAAPAAGH